MFGFVLAWNAGRRLMRRHVACAILVAVFGVFALSCPAVMARAAEPSAKSFLTGIYNAYAGVEAKGVALAQPSEIKRYFSPGLASLMIEDGDRVGKGGDAPVLGGDPFVGHQDADISDVAIEVKESGPAKAVGTVMFSNFGKPEKIVLQLLKVGERDGWRIADIAWNQGTLPDL